MIFFRYKICIISIYRHDYTHKALRFPNKQVLTHTPLRPLNKNCLKHFNRIGQFSYSVTKLSVLLNSNKDSLVLRQKHPPPLLILMSLVWYCSSRNNLCCLLQLLLYVRRWHRKKVCLIFLSYEIISKFAYLNCYLNIIDS